MPRRSHPETFGDYVAECEDLLRDIRERYSELRGPFRKRDLRGDEERAIFATLHTVETRLGALDARLRDTYGAD